MKDIVSYKDCLNCKACCKFFEKYKHLRPLIKIKKGYKKVNLKRKNNYYICSYFKKGLCVIHDKKPFDCKIYPFHFMKNGNDVFLAYDNSCKGIKNKKKKDILKYADYLEKCIKKNNLLKKNKKYIVNFEKWLTPIKKIY
ncbi:YkgJ family cysteine cluster protein [Candidatus Woesearchaeota archaeon]|nr:YkgJ family cysteine cluster protein [Candidatus Woesearchaeota archaeon]